MDSILTQLISLTTPGPLTYVMLCGYTFIYIVGVENIRAYCSLKVQSLKEKIDEEEIIELEKQALLKELHEQIDFWLKSYRIYTMDKLIHDKDILDGRVEDILRKQQEFKKIMEAKESVLLKRRLEKKANKSSSQTESTDLF